MAHTDKQTNKHTNKQTNGHGDSMTDPAQRAKSVKMLAQIYLKIFKYFLLKYQTNYSHSLLFSRLLPPWCPSLGEKAEGSCLVSYLYLSEDPA